MRVFLNLLAAVAGGHLARSRGFLERFHQIVPDAHLIILKERSALTEYRTAPGRTVIDVDLGRGALRALYRTAWENLKLAGLVKQQRADVYLTFSHYLPSLRPLGLPTVMGVSNLAPFSSEAWQEEKWPVRLKMAILRRTILASARRADRVLALSQTGKKFLTAHGVPEEKIRITPNGVDHYWSEKLSPGTRLPARVTRSFLLYVSHFHRYKNHLRLLHAYARMPAEIRAGYQLVFVGEPYNQGYYQEVEALIGKLSLSEHVVVIPGLRGDGLKALYHSASLLVFPSLIENSPAIPLEAMLAGVPVATGELAPMPEICGDGAVYFNALDEASIAGTIEALLRDEGKQAELGRRARLQAARFSWEDFVQKVAGHLEAVVSERRL